MRTIARRKKRRRLLGHHHRRLLRDKEVKMDSPLSLLGLADNQELSGAVVLEPHSRNLKTLT
jgi:hypothetical protein